MRPFCPTGRPYALSHGAAASLRVADVVGFASVAAEDVFVITWLVGWVLLVWAAILRGGCAVVLGLRILRRRSVARSEALLVAASLALIAVVMATHPLCGIGSGVGG